MTAHGIEPDSVIPPEKKLKPDDTDDKDPVTHIRHIYSNQNVNWLGKRVTV